MLKKYGSRYKLIWLKSRRLPGWEERDTDIWEDLIPKEKGVVKLENNISRAKSSIYELALCNKWDYFVTMTLDGEKYDRYNLDAWKKDLSQFVRDQRKKWGADIKYLLIPEQHKLKPGETVPAWHVHGLLAGLKPEMLGDFPAGAPLALALNGYRNYPDYARRFGFCSLGSIRNDMAVSAYILKYVGKQLGQGVEVDKHLYYCSNGLNRAEEIKRGRLAVLPREWDYVNDYVKIAWIEETEIDDYIITQNVMK